MSTRCNIKIIDSLGKELWFYRHSDGYPEGVLPTLNKFLDLVKSGKIRNNVSQASGWLILIGAQEYERSLEKLESGEGDWKVGAYEPTTGEHGDISYLYVVDLDKKTISYS